MSNEHVTHYFLGANSRYGFYSLYDNFIDFKKGDFLWVIKGGPGCGKSSFMKKIGKAAAEKGLPVEYIICSGDPDSVDGVYLPTLRTGYVDGTAPHVIEATYPGAASLYLDLGTFYDAGALERSLEEIIEINKTYKGLYAKAYEYLEAAGGLSAKAYPGLWGEAEKEKIKKKLRGLAAREFKNVQGKGEVHYRYISAISCKGRILLQNTLDNICSRVYAIDNELGMGNFYLSELCSLAQEKGLSVTICPDPLDPNLIEAVMLPELSLGFLAVDGSRQYDGTPFRHLRLDAMADKDAAAAARKNIRWNKKICTQLVDAAMELLSEAKKLHDKLEGYYNPHVDFEGLYGTAKDHITWLFEKN